MYILEICERYIPETELIKMAETILEAQDIIESTLKPSSTHSLPQHTHAVLEAVRNNCLDGFWIILSKQA